MSISEPINSADSGSEHECDGLDLETFFQVEKNPQLTSLDMWGWCRADNLHVKLKENRRLKPLRIHLMKLVTEYLNKINVKYFIYGGTALSVYREDGKMIEHDGDIDIAIVETDFSSAVKNTDSFTAFKEGEVVMSHDCSRYGHDWFDADGKEIPFTGFGGKCLKFFATKNLYTRLGIPADEVFDIGLVHLDVFTLGQHPDNPDCFCVNWNISGQYDYRKKAFPKSIFFPLKTYRFEGLDVTGMNDLKAYLEIEYGYLDRGATYDNETQLYVKISDSVLEQLPCDVQRYMTSTSVVCTPVPTHSTYQGLK